jgi:hypothetical protein
MRALMLLPALLAVVACGPMSPPCGPGGSTSTSSGGAPPPCLHNAALDAPCSQDCDCCPGASCATLTRDGGVAHLCAGTCAPDGGP